MTFAPDDSSRGEVERVEQVQAAWAREVPDADVSSIGLIGRVIDLAHHIERIRGAALTAAGSDRATFDLLATLRRAGPPYRMTAGDLHRASLVTAGAITQRMEKAERAGLIRRAVAPEDGRRVTAELTVQGYKDAERLLNVVMKAEKNLLAPLSSQQRAALRDLLRTWNTALDGTGPGAVPHCS